MAKKRRLMKAAALFAMPAALIAAPVIAHAQAPASAEKQTTNGAELKLLTPRSGETIRPTTFALDVSFQSRNESPVIAAELWVDGVQWTRRNLDTPQLKNVLSFDVEGENLTPGAHLFAIKVYNEDGAVSESQLQIVVAQTVSIPDKAGASAGPEFAIKAPLNGKKVMGVVELQIDTKPINGVNPYITIYVDKQFKTLKNFAPYTYTWDTTTVPNGYHLIEVMGYLDSTNKSSTRRIRVYVDNPGGATVAMKDVPNLDKNAQPAPMTKATENVKPMVIPTPVKPEVKAPTAKPTNKPVAAKPNAVKANVAAATVAPAAAKSAATVAPVAPEATPLPSVTPSAQGGAVPVAPGTINIEVTPKAARQNVSAAAPKAVGVPQPKVINAAVTRTETESEVKPIVPVRPAPAVANKPVKVTAAAPKPMVPMKNNRNVGKATPKAVVRTAGPSVMDSMSSPIQVAFNGTAIAFDVAPRVEGGLPLTPFRQIFEYTGGQVMWVPETKTVRAVNADREVVISVGKDKARVNGQNVTLDRAAFIDRGRTMVPMSFVGQALNVDINYDPATGRVSITSKN